MTENKIPKHIYLFYLVGKFKNEELKTWLEEDIELIAYVNNDPSSKPAGFLYAYATSKKQAKEFMRYRAKERFQIIKRNTRDYFDTYEDYRDFEKTCRYAKISSEDFATKKFLEDDLAIKDNKFYSDVYLTVTRFEAEYVQMVTESESERTSELEPDLEEMHYIVEVLTHDFLKTLNAIGFKELIKFIYNQTVEDNFGRIPMPAICIDEVYILMMYFGELFEY